jgi:hypothetical protein
MVKKTLTQLLLSALYPIRRTTTAIKAIDAALTPSKKNEVNLDLRILAIKGLLINTKTKEGKKIAKVATKAPGKPAIK